jgi:hypothetical protein
MSAASVDCCSVPSRGDVRWGEYARLFFLNGLFSIPVSTYWHDQNFSINKCDTHISIIRNNIDSVQTAALTRNRERSLHSLNFIVLVETQRQLQTTSDCDYRENGKGLTEVRARAYPSAVLQTELWYRG